MKSVRLTELRTDLLREFSAMTEHENGQAAASEARPVVTGAAQAASQSGRRSLAPRVVELLSDRSADALPVWVRAPRGGGVEHYTGLGRSKLYELATAGHIRSVSLRDGSAVKGVRLFCLSSILNFIAKCETEQAVAD